MVIRGAVLLAAGPVVRGDDRDDPVLRRVALVPRHDDRVVTALPDRRPRDGGDRLPEKLVAFRDELASVVHVARVAAVDAPRRGAVHVVALVRHDVAEVRHVSRREVDRELRERHLLRELGGSLKVGEVHDAVVLGDVLRVAVGDPVALAGETVTPVPRVGHVLEVSAPGFPRSLELRHEVLGVDGVAGEEVGVIAVDAEVAAAEHRHVIRLARVGNARVFRREAVGVGHRVDDRCGLVANDLRGSCDFSSMIKNT